MTQSSGSIPMYWPKRRESLHSYKDLYTNAHSSFICNSQELEIALTSTDEWTKSLTCKTYSFL